MRKLLLVVAILLGFAGLYLLYQHKKPLVPFVHDPVVLETIPEVPVNNHLATVIDAINLENSKIQSLYLRQMPIWLTVNGMSFRARGELAHEKEKHFRLYVTTVLTGKEMDIGSNSDIFWFWSKRMNPPALYYSKHENIGKTNLKTPLNPSLMIESLNVGPIYAKNIKSTKESGGLQYLMEERTSPAGEKMTVITILNMDQQKVVGRCLLNGKNENVVTTSYEGKVIKTIWHEEGITMEWDLTGVVLNSHLPARLWVLPDYKNKIDMGK